MKKNIYKFVLALAVVFTYNSCEEDLIIYNGPTAISFAAASVSQNVSIPQEGLTVTIPVESTTASAEQRTFTVTVDESSTGGSAEYTIGSAVIPANEYVGSLTVTFNYDAIADGAVNTVVLNLLAPDGGSSFRDSASIEYFREIVCNDVVVAINFDDYPGETTWEITSQADGSVVASGGPYGGETSFSQSYFLADGCYTFTIFDAFGDGICCGYGEGDYSVTCSILTHASGGVFGASESTDFCVNP